MLVIREEDSMGRRGYPSEFRRRVLDLIVCGRKVHEVARDLGITDQAIYVWRRQERIDRGEELGLTSSAPGRNRWRHGAGSTSWRLSSPSIAGRRSY
jgi:transposase-like protein